MSALGIASDVGGLSEIVDMITSSICSMSSGVDMNGDITGVKFADKIKSVRRFR